MSIKLQYWFQTRAALIKALVWNEATISHQVTLQPGLVSHFCGREVKEIREIIFRDQMAIIKTSFSVLIMMMGGKCNFQSPFRGLAVVTCEGNAMSAPFPLKNIIHALHRWGSCPSGRMLKIYHAVWLQSRPLPSFLLTPYTYYS